MNVIDSKLDNNSNEMINYTEENIYSKTNLKHSCEVMIDFKTFLCPPPKKNTEVEQIINVDAKIEKVCAGKIIIGGIVHKTIKYKAVSKDGCCCKNCTKHKDIPFSCFIDIYCGCHKDKFEIVDCPVICSFSKVIYKKDKCIKKAILIEKDIIKIIVKRIPCWKYCSYKFCGKTVIDSEVCFVPAVDKAKSSISVSVDPANFKVDLVCCDMIVVSGFITKTITFTDGRPTTKKDILVQINVPACINDYYKKPEKWIVTKAEFCTGCFTYTCPSTDTNSFHKLVEKDIIAVEVKNKHL